MIGTINADDISTFLYFINNQIELFSFLYFQGFLQIF